MYLSVVVEMDDDGCNRANAYTSKGSTQKSTGPNGQMCAHLHLQVAEALLCRPRLSDLARYCDMG